MTTKGMIFLKYTESTDPRKKAVNSGLYVIIGVCILIIGGASWFAVRSANSANSAETPQSSNQSEYNSPSTSYNESVLEPPTISQPMADSVSDQPYSSESQVTSKPETQPAPVFAMPIEGEILKKHSDTELQFSATYGDLRLHTGVDIAAAKGTVVTACADGKIVGIELGTTFGNVITIEHSGGITSKYSAIDNISVKNGEKVKVGDRLGTVTTVPAECMDREHLHFEVFKNSKSVDPIKTLGLD